MAHTSNSPQISPGYDHFDLWVMEVFQLFAAKWWVWLLQGLIFYAIIGAAVSIIVLTFDPETLFSVLENWGRIVLVPRDKGGVYFISALIALIAFILLYPGFFVTALKQIRGRDVGVGDIFAGMKYSGGFLVLSVIYLVTYLMTSIFANIIGSIITDDPFFRSIIANMVLHLALILILAWEFMVMPMLMDRKEDIISTMSMSYHATMKKYGYFVAFIIVLGLIMLAISIVGYFIPYMQLITGLFTVSILPIAAVVAYERTFAGYGNSSTPKMQLDEPIPPPYMPTPPVDEPVE